jgi:hypothetical protein
MATKSSQVRWIVALGAIVLVGVLFYSTMQQAHNRFEVCMSFKGGLHCSTAEGSTSDQAIRSAQEIDCELLSNGRDENMVCLASAPASVRAIK